VKKIVIYTRRDSQGKQKSCCKGNSTIDRPHFFISVANRLATVLSNS
jgi:hypothetical protein